MQPVPRNLVLLIGVVLVFLALFGLFMGVRGSASKFPQPAATGPAGAPGLGTMTATEATPFVEPPPSAAPPAPPKPGPQPSPAGSSAPAVSSAPPASSAPPPKPAPASPAPTKPPPTDVEELY